MNSSNIGRLVIEAFPTVPSRASIPDPQKRWHGDKTIKWEVGGLNLRTYKHTWGRIFVRATSSQYPDEAVEVYASNHKAAIRALVKYCHTFFSEEATQ